MNTPRELLLARHDKTWRALASARRHALLESLPASRLLWWQVLLAEIFAPQRAVWAAVGASWILIIIAQRGTLHRGPDFRAPPVAGQAGLISPADGALLAQLDGWIHPEGAAR